MERPVVYRDGTLEGNQRLGQHLPRSATTTPRTIGAQRGMNHFSWKSEVKLRDPDLDFIIVGENIPHCTRVVMRKRQAE